jgi:aspartate-semialdehyde dehydrogenase
MSSTSKPATTSQSDAARSGLYRVAIVGAASLKGKEVAEVLSDRNFPALDVKLLDDDESLGQLESVGDEMAFIQGVSTEGFNHIDFAFFTSTQEFTRSVWKRVRDAGSAIVDLSYALEDEPDALVRSPWIERQLAQSRPLELQPGPSVVAHPASVVLALLLLRVQQTAKLNRVTATIFEPVSEQGQKGMDELHEQTVNLLSFQPLPKNIFDTQVAFNMVSRYGEQSMLPLASTERRVLKHYQTIAGKDQIVPSLLLVQAPIFHGHAFALHLELEQAADISALSKALSGEHINVIANSEEAPSNVNAAGQGDILLSIMPDANHPNGVWLWAASDNLRISATTAVECAETMAASRPRGKIQ